MDSVPLHHQLARIWWKTGCPLTKPQRQNWGLLRQALAFSPDCHLLTLALRMPIDSDRDSLGERLRRLLKNETVSQLECYPPLDVTVAQLGWARNPTHHGSYRHRKLVGYSQRRDGLPGPDVALSLACDTVWGNFRSGTAKPA